MAELACRSFSAPRSDAGLAGFGTALARFNLINSY
jgi:hypothetical protein